MPATEPRDQLLRRRLAAPLAGKAGAEHPDPELVVAHAAGELSPEYALALTRHLTLCDDGRCNAVLRDVIAGAAVAREALYPSDRRRDEESDGGLAAPARHPRTFLAADDLWEAFEALARDEARSPDALLEDAMRAYAQQQASPQRGPVPPREVTVRDAPHDPPRERNTPTLQRAYLPRAPASSRRASPHPQAPAAHLCVVVEGTRYEVTKERFVVGRGGRSSDLAIDDPVVSRQHAHVERAGGTYYLVDMGSTNGVEYQGERIARRAIAHGDCFRIGDHELEFLFT